MMDFAVRETADGSLKNRIAADADAGSKDADARFRKTARDIGRCILFAVPVFFVFVLTARLGGYDLLDLTPENVLPPIPVYLADFSLAFTSKLLIGSITRLFSETLTLKQMYVICGIADIAAVAALSLFFGALIDKGIRRKNFYVLFLCALCLVNPLLSQEFYPAIGCYNAYWTVFFIVLLFLYGKISFAFAAPLLCFTGMLVHDGFLFAFLPAVLVLLVYDFFNEPTKRGRRIAGASFAVTSLSCGGLFVYSSFFASRFYHMNADEFHNYIVSRFDATYGETLMLKKLYGDRLFPYSFFEVYFFDRLIAPEDAAAMDPLSYFRISSGNRLNILTDGFYLQYAVVLVPFALLFFILWFFCAKKSSGAKKIPFIFFACIQLVILPVCLISTDMHRWIPAVILSQAGLLFAMLKRRDPVVEDVIGSGLPKKPYAKVILLIAGICLTVYMLHFGTSLPMYDDVI